MYIYSMKKLPLFLALAFVFSSNVFAEGDKNKFKGKGKKYTSEECARYSLSKEGYLFLDGVRNDTMGIVPLCRNKIKGYNEALFYQKGREKELRKANPAPLRPEMQFKLDSLKREQNKNKPRK